mmetsp:Transcript_72747/g.118010  ORF Transcript_72747/g.118010 Transcript_72747/m.118010 type:complete len:142 (+) Transcript_72747:281-706(+)
MESEEEAAASKQKAEEGMEEKMNAAAAAAKKKLLEEDASALKKNEEEARKEKESPVWKEIFVGDKSRSQPKRFNKLFDLKRSCQHDIEHCTQTARSMQSRGNKNRESIYFPLALIAHTLSHQALSLFRVVYLRWLLVQYAH